MADNSYTLEIKKASQFKDGVKRWFTPQESNDYYATDYARTGITIHWWGDGSGASNHDNIVNFFLNRTSGSVHYVLSDNKITYMVSPDMVAFTSQSGNPTTIAIEHQPTLGAEGYKKSGWLVDQLEQRYGRKLTLYPHKHWSPTACPGTLDLNRIRAEADKWKSGVYDKVDAPPAPAPAPIPAPPKTVSLTIKDVPNTKVKLVRTANLWDLQFAKYADAKAVKQLDMIGTNSAGGFEVSAVVTHPTGSQYYISEYSYAKGLPMGVNVKDTDHPDPEKLNVPVSIPPVVVDVPVVKPIPEPAPPVVIVDKNKAVQEQLSAAEAALAKIKELLGLK